VRWGVALILSLDKLTLMQVLELSVCFYMVVKMFTKLLLLAYEIWIRICTLFFLVQMDICGHYITSQLVYVILILFETFVTCIHWKTKISLYIVALTTWKYLIVILCTDFGNLHEWLAWQEVAVKKFLDQDFSGDALAQFKSEVSHCLYMDMYNAVIRT